MRGLDTMFMGVKEGERREKRGEEGREEVEREGVLWEVSTYRRAGGPVSYTNKKEGS